MKSPAVNRKQFLNTLAAAALWPGIAGASTRGLDLGAIEHDRVIALAEAALNRDIRTLTTFPAPRSPGGVHDYYSEGDYWWPDPAKPGGPYIRRDGQSNPEKFDGHRLALIRFSLDMPALTAAWLVTGRDAFAIKAVAHLSAWFVAADTHMAPNLEHAQAIVGLNTGRGIGIIDTLHLVEVARAFENLRKAPARLFADTDKAAVSGWFTTYLAWLVTSANGLDEASQKNNHGTAWWLQVTQFARVTGNTVLPRRAADWVRTTMTPQQIASDGSMPLELARTKPYAYCLFNLEVMSALFHCLAEVDRSLWTYETTDGRSLAKAEAFMYPFIKDKTRWPYPPDVENFADFPIRQNSLLFCGMALGRADYIALWRALPADSAVPEVIRNTPVRQPLLWFPPSASAGRGA